MKPQRKKEGKEGAVDKEKWKVGDYEVQNVLVKNKNR